MDPNDPFATFGGNAFGDSPIGMPGGPGDFGPCRVEVLQTLVLVEVLVILIPEISGGDQGSFGTFLPPGSFQPPGTVQQPGAYIPAQVGFAPIAPVTTAPVIGSGFSGNDGGGSSWRFRRTYRF